MFKCKPRIPAADDPVPRLDDNVCFQHDGKSPTEIMWGDFCESHNLRTESFEGPGYPANTYCDFDLTTGLFSWVNETS